MNSSLAGLERRAIANPRRLVLVVLAVAWIVLDAFVVPPAFGYIDVYYFKDAALNFAEGHGLVTRFMYGNPSFDYRDFAIYPPLYPYLFGIWSRLAGISIFTNQLFNTLAAAFTGVMVFTALAVLIRSARPAAANPHSANPYLGLLCIIALATGFFGPPPDRPDGVGVALGVGGILLSASAGVGWRNLLGGALCCLTLFTSPFAGIWTCLATLTGIVCVSFWDAAERGQAVRRLLLIGLGGLCMAAVIVGALRAWLPGWFDAFLGVATGAKTNNETGGGYFIALLHGHVATWAHAFPLALSSFYVGLAKLAAVQIALVCWIVSDRIRAGAASRAWRLTPLVLLGPLPLLTSPYQGNYPPMAAALLLAGWCAFAAYMPQESRRLAVRTALMAFAAVMLLALPFVARDLAIRRATGPSIERAKAFITAHHEELFAPDTLVAVSPLTYMLWRQAGLHPLITVYSGLDDARNRERVRYVSLAYPGSSDALHAQQPPWLDAREYQTVAQPTLPQLATVLGYPVSRASQTWETQFLERRPLIAQPTREIRPGTVTTAASRPTEP